MRILVVDQDPNFCQAINQLLVNLEIEVLTTNSFLGAVQLLPQVRGRGNNYLILGDLGDDNEVVELALRASQMSLGPKVIAMSEQHQIPSADWRYPKHQLEQLVELLK